MRLAAILLLGTSLLAAGCKPAPAEKSIREKEAERSAEVARITGWDKFWKAPDAAVGAANQFGFRATPYAASGHVGRSTGGPVMLAGSTAAKPNQASFAAEGPSATQVDTIRFDLALTDDASATDARKRFAALVRDYLFQAKIDGATLLPALEQGTPARGNLAGTPYSIEKSDSAGGSAGHLSVTFNRSGADAPEPSKPQGN
jgi:hypothetical protein